MVTISILAILAAIASPSMAPFIAKQRMKALAQNLTDSLHLARSEALSNGNTFQLVPIDNSTWAKGWNVEYIPTSGNKEVFKRYPQNHSSLNVRVNSRTGNKNIIEFNQNARVNSMVNFEIAHTHLDIDSYCIEVAASGNVQISKATCDGF